MMERRYSNALFLRIHACVYTHTYKYTYMFMHVYEYTCIFVQVYKDTSHVYLYVESAATATIYA